MLFNAFQYFKTFSMLSILVNTFFSLRFLYFSDSFQLFLIFVNTCQHLFNLFAMLFNTFLMFFNTFQYFPILLDTFQFVFRCLFQCFSMLDKHFSTSFRCVSKTFLYLFDTFEYFWIFVQCFFNSFGFIYIFNTFQYFLYNRSMLLHVFQHLWTLLNTFSKIVNRFQYK